MTYSINTLLHAQSHFMGPQSPLTRCPLVLSGCPLAFLNMRQSYCCHTTDLFRICHTLQVIGESRSEPIPGISRHLPQLSQWRTQGRPKCALGWVQKLTHVPLAIAILLVESGYGHERRTVNNIRPTASIWYLCNADALKQRKLLRLFRLKFIIKRIKVWLYR